MIDIDDTDERMTERIDCVLCDATSTTLEDHLGHLEEIHDL